MIEQFTDRDVNLRIGLRIGKLIIINPKYKRTHNLKEWYAKCKCDCGNIYYITRGNLKNNLINNRQGTNCGCLPSKHTVFTESNLNRTTCMYRNSAHNRKIEWNLTEEQAKQILLSNCYYCGCNPGRKHKAKHRRTSRTIIINGIDRLDNSIGYTTTNSVPCCRFCNIAKSTLGVIEFLDKIKEIYINLNLYDEYNILKMVS